MRAYGVLLLALLFAVPTPRAQSGAVSFNLSTSKSLAPGEQPKIHLYTHKVDALEFRVYRVNAPVKFMENLRELHSFGHGWFAGVVPGRFVVGIFGPHGDGGTAAQLARKFLVAVAAERRIQ